MWSKLIVFNNSVHLHQYDRYFFYKKKMSYKGVGILHSSWAEKNWNGEAACIRNLFCNFYMYISSRYSATPFSPYNSERTYSVYVPVNGHPRYNVHSMVIIYENDNGQHDIVRYMWRRRKRDNRSSFGA